VDRLAADRHAWSIHRAVNQTAAPYPARSNVKAWFEDCVRRRADERAVVGTDRTLTYRELNGRANEVAWDLRRAGVEPGDMVGVCVDRSPEMVVALVAVIKCGAAYVPFDEEWPGERLRQVFARAGCDLVLTDRPARLSARFPQLRVVPVTGTPHPVTRANPVTRLGPDSVAYINFTSGSTGGPKGVPIQHRAILRLVLGARYARLDERSVLLHMAPISFDAATFEIWGALLCGGTCVLYPTRLVRIAELRRVIERQRITVIFLTTALFNVVVDEAPETLDSVETILTGGEAHSLRHIDRALRHYGPDRLVSVYGPTESTTFATYYPVRTLRADVSALPIGLPIQNTRLYLVDGGRLCEPREVGEICLAGPGLSPGYLGMADATRERFVECEIDGVWERLYRTGDRGYFLEDGNVVFHGRLDDQTKINGHRVELGEIAYHLDQHPHVRQSYVTVAKNALGERSLLAFIVPGTGDGEPDSVREFLRDRLPRYMVPARIVPCAELPLSATGKVDRRALLAEHSP
jgi:D-alanine--poly(phosphoribitol) ligase subunit 1